MKKQDPSLDLQKLSLSIGNFIRYWGFRRIHGAIWTQLYLSMSPLSCTDLTERLDVSKALVSPALAELCDYKLIKEIDSTNGKTKLYIAAENINEVIQHVLKMREAVMLKKISDDFSSLLTSANKNNQIDASKVEKLGEMIFSAELMLKILLSQNDLLNLPIELGLN